jgi:hypothetical protein
MCSPQSADVVREVVSEFVDDDRLFTAFDVSKEVQKRLTDRNLPFERHRHLKGTIHQELEQFTQTGVYERQLHDVGAPTQAFLYFPPNTDPNDYVPQDRPQKAVQTTTAPVGTPHPATNKLTLATDDDDDEGDEKDTGRTPDNRGTLGVPGYILTAAGFSDGETAYVESSNDNGTPILTLVKRATNPLTSYTVLPGDRVRINAGTLAQCGIGGANNGYDFERDGDKVVVKVH